MADASLSATLNVQKVFHQLVEACVWLVNDPSSNKLSLVPCEFSEREADMYRSVLGMVTRLLEPDTIEMYERYFKNFLTGPFKVKLQYMHYLLEDVLIELFKRASRQLERYRWTGEENPFKPSLGKSATPFHAAVIDSLLYTSILVAGLRRDVFDKSEEERVDIKLLTRNAFNTLFNVFGGFDIAAHLEAASDPFGRGGRITLLGEGAGLQVTISRDESNEIESSEEDDWD